MKRDRWNASVAAAPGDSHFCSLVHSIRVDVFLFDYYVLVPAERLACNPDRRVLVSKYSESREITKTKHR